MVRKNVQNTFSKFIFSLFFVYVMLLGIFNVVIFFYKKDIEYFLAKALNAQKVLIGNISNLPLVFVSCSDIFVEIDPSFTLKIEGIYINYRFWKLVLCDFAKVIREFRIDTIKLKGHRLDIKTYFDQMKSQYQKVDVQVKSSNHQELLENISEKNRQNFADIANEMIFLVKVHQVEMVINSLTEFWNSIFLDKINVEMNNGALTWNGDLTLHSKWSNSVFLLSSSTTTTGMLTNFQNLNGKVMVDVFDLNFGGLPLIKEKTTIQVCITNNQANFHLINNEFNQIDLETDDQFKLSIDRPFQIEYRDFEEFNLLDYVFAPGFWNFKSTIDFTKHLILDIALESPKHPGYGFWLKVKPLQNKMYQVKLDLNTHFFGAVKGSLVMPSKTEEKLYPLPTGTLILKDTRFILPGLVFSGNASISAVPGENKLDIIARNVLMNNGLIGDTAVTFDFTSLDYVQILPKYIDNRALSVYASLGPAIQVNIEAFDVDGDFVAQNIKLPIFGLKESRYRGVIDLFKEKRSPNLLLVGDIQGYLNGEKQVQALLNLDQNTIHVPMFYFVDQDLKIEGSVEIENRRSNTYINIEADAVFKKNDPISLDFNLDIQKTNIFAKGMLDGVVPIKLKGNHTNVNLEIKFDQYPLNKVSLSGNVTAQLIMHFSPKGVTRFAIQNGDWVIDNRHIIIDFDAIGKPEKLKTTYMKMGVDTDILDATGYFSFLPQNTMGAFRFTRGGGVQFNIKQYTITSKIDLRDLTVDNLFELPILEPINFLKNAHTETLRANVDLIISGLWSNLNYTGNLHVESLNKTSFVFSIPQFSKQDSLYCLTNLRLRHDFINLDIDAAMTNKNDFLYADISGSLVSASVLKTDFTTIIEKTPKKLQINYQLPNLYVLSKIPMELSGTILQTNSVYLLMSDDLKTGLTGSASYNKNIMAWDTKFVTDSVHMTSKGELKNQSILASLNLDVNLNKLKPSGDIKKIRGLVGFDLTAEGLLNHPILNGALTLDNLIFKIKSLKNELKIPEKVSIPVINNLIVFPDIPILSSKDSGKFSLDGTLLIQDLGIGNADIRFFSQNENNRQSSLNWNLSVPYLTVKGKTFIDQIKLTGNFSKLLLSANISTEHLNLGLELGDSLNDLRSTTANTVDINPALLLLSLFELDINIDMTKRTKFVNQLFDIQFEQVNPIVIGGNIANGTTTVDGYLNISKGSVSYLANNLKVSTGHIQFSGEAGDPYPYINIKTETTERTFQNESVDIYVDFEGKVPNIELAKVTSSPFKPVSELYALLGMGSSSSSVGMVTADAARLSQNIFTSSIGVVENAFFTAPLSKQIKKLIPFLDTFNIKTDVLGNVSRSLSEGGSVSGINILHGSELEIGQYLPGLQGLQMKYNLRLESPENSKLNMGTSLDRIHKGGLEWTYLLPMQAQLGLGASVLGEEKSLQQNQQKIEVLGELSLKKRF